jgi:opacity protein-like surface antigen
LVLLISCKQLFTGNFFFSPFTLFLLHGTNVDFAYGELKSIYMKKNIFIITLLFMAIAVNAQGRGSVEGILSAGYNSATVTSDQYGTADSRGSYNLTAGLDFYLSRSWSIKVKGIRDKKGFNNVIFTDQNGRDFRSDVRLDYITVPLQASWHFGGSKNWYLSAGPYVGFLTDASESRYNQNLKPDFNDTDAGIALTFGVKIPVGDRLRIFLEYDYQEGFSELYKVRYDNEHVNTSRGAFNVGLNFLLQ